VKKIEAIIQPHKLEQVRDALKDLGVDGITISEVRGHGRQKGHTEMYRGQEYTVDLLPKIKLELVVADTQLEQTVGKLGEAARCGKIGDGGTIISSIDEAIRIRNGDRGESAL